MVCWLWFVWNEQYEVYLEQARREFIVKSRLYSVPPTAVWYVAQLSPRASQFHNWAIGSYAFSLAGKPNLEKNCPSLPATSSVSSLSSSSYLALIFVLLSFYRQSLLISHDSWGLNVIAFEATGKMDNLYL